jgi:hypothetical protein
VLSIDVGRVSRRSRRLFLVGTGSVLLGACGQSGTSAANDSSGGDLDGPTLSGQDGAFETVNAGDVIAIPTNPDTPIPRSFVHPGLLHTEPDFVRMRAKVAGRAEPWVSGWNALIANGYSQINAAPRPLATVIRGGAGTNVNQLIIDIQRTYQLALRWKVSGDSRYAEQAVLYLNSWSGTLQTIGGNADRYIAAGLQGYEFANAGELMRDYPGWAVADFRRFQDMMLNVFYPLSSRFLKYHNDAVITNYWANWDLANLACVLAVGVVCDRFDIYQEALDYYYRGQGNGAALQAVYYVHPGYLGQWQESGCDQGHCTLGIGIAAAIAEMAWNQGDDLYGYDNSRFLAGAEYVAKSNSQNTSGAFNSVPFLPYNNKQGYKGGLSPASLGHRRPVWESVLHHYEGRRGIGAPYVKQQALLLRPEVGGPLGDQLAFGTLTFARDPIVQGPPKALTALQKGSNVVLSWWGVPGGISYNLKRATQSGGPYTSIASDIRDTLTWSDSTASGAAYYVVTALSTAGESLNSNEVRVQVPPTLQFQVKGDEGSGTAAADSTGNWPASTVNRLTSWAAGRGPGSSMGFNGTSDFVTLPRNITKALGDFSITCWVYLNTNRAWARIFDVGSGPRRSMYLTPKNAAGVLQFSLDLEHGYVAQIVTGNSGFPLHLWTHIGITLRGSLLTLYVNGVQVGAKTDTVFCPRDLGEGMMAWLGKSQYVSDPLLDGRVSDFRIYSGAISAADVTLLAAS